jgi:hypothetical protein
MNFIAKHKIAYAAVPKVACTSIKHLLFSLENGGRPFQPFRANGKAYNVHTLYPSRLFESGYKFDSFKEYFKFAVIRDPIARFVSAYSNRVVYYRDIGEKQLDKEAIKAGLKPNPELGFFIENIAAYRQWSNQIRHHTDSLTSFVGPDLSRYDAVYPIEELARCAADLSRILGREIEIPHKQTGGPKVPRDTLTANQIRILTELYREDYALLHDYYQAPAI